MAGPFSSSGNQAGNIPGVQQKGGFAPVPGIADAVKAVADVALPAIKQNHIDNLQEDITGQTDSIKTALLARANPALAQSLFTEEALANPATAAAFAQFNDIASAVQQGRLPGQFALERLSVIQNDAIAEAPEFEQEIRAAMLQATGQDPEKRLFSTLLSDQQQGLSAEAKFQQKLEQDARRVGLTVPAFIEANNAVFVAQAESAEFSRAKLNGTMNLRKVSKAVNNRAGLIMMDIMKQSREQFTSGAGLSPEFISNSKQQLSSSVAAAIAQITSTAGDAVDSTEIAAAVAPLEKLQGQIEGMIDDGSWQALITNTNVLNKGLVEGQILQFTDLGTAWTLGGPTNFLEVLKVMEKASNPQVRKLLDNLSGKAEGATLLGESVSGVRQVATPMGIAKQYGQLGTGTATLDTATKNERIIAANTALQTIGGREEAHEAAMSDLESISTDHAWTAYENKKVIAATLQSTTLKSKFIPLQAQQTAALSQAYFNLTNLTGFRADKFELVGSQLVYKQEGFQGGQGTRLEIDNEAPSFVKRFNRANAISSKYAGVGVLPAARYTNTQDYFDVVTSAVKDALDGDQQPAADETGVVEWGRDENGKPVRIK